MTLIYAALLPKTKKLFKISIGDLSIACRFACDHLAALNDDDMISRSRSSRNMLLLSLQLPN